MPLSNALLLLEQVDQKTWNHHHVMLHTWGIGRFDSPMTLDYLMSHDVGFTLREGMLKALDRMLFFVGK